MNMARAYMEENKTSRVRFPVDVADYMIKHDITGRIFNEYGIGGYLIYRLSPTSQVYIDGRTGILYPVEHYLRLLEAKKSPDILRAEIEKHDINLAVLQNKQRNFRLVMDTGDLQLDYVGSKFSLFRRNNPNFPNFGALLAYWFINIHDNVRRRFHEKPEADCLAGCIPVHRYNDHYGCNGLCNV